MSQVDSHCRTSNSSVFPLAYFKAFTTFSLKTAKAKMCCLCWNPEKVSGKTGNVYPNIWWGVLQAVLAPADSTLLGAPLGLVPRLSPTWSGLRGTRQWEHIQRTCCTMQKLGMFYCVLGVSWSYFSNILRTAVKMEKNTLHDYIWQEMIHLSALEKAPMRDQKCLLMV